MAASSCVIAMTQELQMHNTAPHSFQARTGTQQLCSMPAIGQAGSSTTALKHPCHLMGVPAETELPSVARHSYTQVACKAGDHSSPRTSRGQACDTQAPRTPHAATPLGHCRALVHSAPQRARDDLVLAAVCTTHVSPPRAGLRQQHHVGASQGHSHDVHNCTPARQRVPVHA